MKVIITALSMAFLIASVVAEFDQWFKDNNYTDADAFYLSQENYTSSMLLPPKEVYELISNELIAIRAKYPEVAHIRHQPLTTPGKLFMEHFDLERLNASPYGPIDTVYLNQREQLNETRKNYLVTLGMPYYTGNNQLSLTLARDYSISLIVGHMGQSSPIRPEPLIGHIERQYSVGLPPKPTIIYMFTQWPKPCFGDIKECMSMKPKQWMFLYEIKPSTITLV